MRTTIFVNLLLLTACACVAQETPPNLRLEPPPPSVSRELPFELPEPLTNAALKEVFSAARNGRYEPMKVTHAVIAKGVAVVPALEGILLGGDSTEQATHDPSSGDTLRLLDKAAGVDVSPYVISSLQAIGTEECFDILMDCALRHPDPDARAASLAALGHSYHDRVAAEELKPNTKVVHVLMQCADEKELAPFPQKSIGDVARTALVKWLGVELGEVSESPSTVIVGREKTQMTIQQYREYWWNEISPGLIWSREEGRFISSK